MILVADSQCDIGFAFEVNDWLGGIIRAGSMCRHRHGTLDLIGCITGTVIDIICDSVCADLGSIDITVHDYPIGNVPINIIICRRTRIMILVTNSQCDIGFTFEMNDWLGGVYLSSFF